MKRHIRILSLLLCALLLLLTLCACKKTDPEPKPEPEPEPTPTPDPEPTPEPQGPQPVACEDEKLEKTISDEQGNELIRISLTVPKPESMAEAQQYYQDWLNDTAYYCEQDQEDAAAMRVTQTELGGTFIPYSYEASYELLRNDGVLLSVYRTYYANTGGVHPNTSVLAETFVVETGAMLVLDDVFTVPSEQYLPRLMELIGPMMDEKAAEYGQDPYYEGVRDTLAEVYNPKNFALTDDSLLIFFPTYDIAPYAAGTQEFPIPLSALSDILNPAWTA